MKGFRILARLKFKGKQELSETASRSYTSRSYTDKIFLMLYMAQEVGDEPNTSEI